MGGGEEGGEEREETQELARWRSAIVRRSLGQRRTEHVGVQGCGPADGSDGIYLRKVLPECGEVMPLLTTGIRARWWTRKRQPAR